MTIMCAKVQKVPSVWDKKTARVVSRGLLGTHTLQDRYFTITCKLLTTGEKFPLKNIYNEMKIRDLKAFVEFATGIPANLQRLCYLDEGDLQDHTDIRRNDIVPGAVLHLKVWHTWDQLVEAAATNDMERVFELGVSVNSDFHSPNCDYMASINPALRKRFLDERAFVALYIASHRGHQRLVEKLIQAGANVNTRTPYGRSPLHMAAARGHGKIVDLLLEKGADIDAEDDSGETPLSVAAQFGHKACERHLFQFRWQQRAKQTLKNKMRVDMLAHQYFDSANPVWLKGRHGQIYYTQILPPGEFGGTALNAPLRRPPGGDQEQEQHRTSESDSDSEDEEFEIQTGITRKPPTMPAIREEKQRSRGSTENKPTKSAPGLQRTQAKQTRFSRSGKDGQTKSASFDDWLLEKKTKEQIQLTAKRREQHRQKLVEDDKKRDDDFQSKSYASWLAGQETANKKTINIQPEPLTRSLPDADIEETGRIMGRLEQSRKLWQSPKENVFLNMKSRVTNLAQLYS